MKSSWSRKQQKLSFGILGLALAACSTQNRDPAFFSSNSDVEAREDYNTEQVEKTPTDLGFDGDSAPNSAEIEADLLAQKTFPLVHNEFVEKWIQYFTSERGRPVFQKWLGRSTRFIPTMRQILREEGLPEDLIYLSMIESGFNTRAYSRAAAVGPWQFIRDTGKRYGMKISTWVDERRDVEKSTRAAAVYLRELHQVFGSWYLAAASYNAGEGRTLRAVRTDKTRNFWQLARKRKNFRAETRNYVPKIIAAALISKNPGKYGFTSVEYQEPLPDYEMVNVGERRDLKSVAKVSQTDFELIRILNAELRLGVTPPNGVFPVKVPKDKAALLSANLEQVQTRTVPLFANHRIRRGETVSGIARRYSVKMRDVMAYNNIRSAHRIRAGQNLKIPLNKNARRALQSSRKQNRSSGGGNFSPKDMESIQIRRGDTLYDIAREYKTSVKNLKRLNSLRGNQLQAGQKLLVPKAKNQRNLATQEGGKVVTIQHGDTLWDIAQRYGVSVAALKKHNNIRRSRSLRPGQELQIPD